MVYEAGAEMTRRSGRPAIAAAVLALVTHVACTSGGDVGGSATTSTASDSAEATRVEHAVGKRRTELVDRTRPTAADPNRRRAENIEPHLATWGANWDSPRSWGMSR